MEAMIVEVIVAVGAVVTAVALWQRNTARPRRSEVPIRVTDRRTRRR